MNEGSCWFLLISDLYEQAALNELMTCPNVPTPMRQLNHLSFISLISIARAITPKLRAE